MDRLKEDILNQDTSDTVAVGSYTVAKIGEVIGLATAIELLKPIIEEEEN